MRIMYIIHKFKFQFIAPFIFIYGVFLIVNNLLANKAEQNNWDTSR